MNIKELHNPVWKRSDNLRDPSVFKASDGYYLFYSRYSNNDWTRAGELVCCVYLYKRFY